MELAREREMLVIILDDFRTNRKHLDLAQERVLPTSKTALLRMPGRACPWSEGGFELLSGPLTTAGCTFQLSLSSFHTRNSSKLNRQQAGN